MSSWAGFRAVTGGALRPPALRLAVTRPGGPRPLTKPRLPVVSFFRSYQPREYERPMYYDEGQAHRQPKSKGRWVFRLLLLANCAMFVQIHFSQAKLKAFAEEPAKVRVARAVREWESKGHEMTPKRLEILYRWDDYAQACHRAVVTRCATSLKQWREKDYLSFFLAPISQVDPYHLLVNLAALFFLGRTWLSLNPTLGFGKLALGSAAAGNFGQYANNALNGKPEYKGLGASGMTSGIAGALLVTVPFRKIYDLALMVGVQWAYGAHRVANPKQGDRIGHGAHLGGAAFGISYGLFLRLLMRGRAP